MIDNNNPRQKEIAGCKMLPHIRYNPMKENLMKAFATVIPVIFAIMYGSVRHDKKCFEEFKDPKNLFGDNSTKW